PVRAIVARLHQRLLPWVGQRVVRDQSEIYSRLFVIGVGGWGIHQFPTGLRGLRDRIVWRDLLSWPIDERPDPCFATCWLVGATPMLSICRVEFGAYDVPRLSALCHGCERHHRRWGSVIADRLVEADQSISPRRNLLSRDQLHSDRIAHTLDFGRSFSCDLRHCCCLGCRR